MGKSRLFTSGYIPHVHKDFDHLISLAEFHLKGRHYDTMIGTGMSGSLVVPRLAEALGKHWLLLRKPSENSHTSQLAEGRLGERWIFVDDFVSSGATFRRVRDWASTYAAEFGGVFQYRSGGKFTPASQIPSSWRDSRY